MAGVHSKKFKYFQDFYEKKKKPMETVINFYFFNDEKHTDYLIFTFFNSTAAMLTFMIIAFIFNVGFNIWQVDFNLDCY